MTCPLPPPHNDQWVRLPTWGLLIVLLVIYSKHSAKMHYFSARGKGQTDRQTDWSIETLLKDSIHSGDIIPKGGDYHPTSCT